MKDFIEKIQMTMQRVMLGRHGVDHLSLFLLATTLATSLLGALFSSIVFPLLSVLLLIIFYYRMFSKSLYKRQQENFKFLRLWSPFYARVQKKYTRVKSMRTHKYFKCSSCKQTLRVPRGKGNLSVTCPKCKHLMHKKS